MLAGRKENYMIYPIRFSNTASSQFEKLKNKELKERIARTLEYIASDPMVGKPLQAEFKGCYSYRIGDYRVIYAFSKSEKYLDVIRIDHRREVYR